MITLPELNQRLKEYGLEIYDFGDSVIVMPIPDFSGQGSFVHSAIFFVMEKRKDLGEDYAFFLGIEMSPKYYDKNHSQYLLPDDFAEKLVPQFHKWAHAVIGDDKGAPMKGRRTIVQVMDPEADAKAGQ